ncbi:MAG: hypothetical protein CMH41_04400 [Micrococcales bacterium]|nr:hypothetical protein [Micrococcales bacterium]
MTSRGVPVAYTTPVSPNPEPPSEDDIKDMLSQIGSNWGVVLAFGVITLLIGIAVMAWPNATVGIIGILLGIWLLISGIFSLVGSFTTSGDTGNRVLMGIAGAIAIILGVLCFRGEAVEILALFVGIGWLLQGIFQTIVGAQAKGQPGRGWDLFLGILGIVAGIVVLVWPAPSLFVLAWVAGIWFVILGIITIVAAFRLKSAAEKIATESDDSVVI